MEPNWAFQKKGLSNFKALDDDWGALVYVFGQNSYGELGIGDLEERHVPTKLSYFDNIEISQVAAGNEHTAVLTKTGQVYTFGFNGSGQLGHGNTKSYHLPRLIETLNESKITNIASANGCEHLSWVTSKGEMYMWGFNNYGQLGNGNHNNVTTPALIPDFQGKWVLFVAWSYYHTIIVTDESTENPSPTNKKPEKTYVYSVGRNDSGQLGLEHNNHEFFPKIISSLSSKIVVKAAWGLHHSVFLTHDGLIYSTGFNDNGQLGLGDKILRNTPTLVSSLDSIKVVDIAWGYYHTIWRINNGDVYSFGRNDKGQWGIDEIGSSFLIPVKIKEFEVPTSMSSVFGITSETFKNCKYNDLMKDFIKIPWTKISKIAWGWYHSILLSENGYVFTFGRGNHGQLGHGSKDNISIPKIVSFFQDKKAIDIAGGFYHSIVLVNSRGPKLNSLSYDMKKLISDPSRWDITFKVGKEMFHAHRCIIFARCKELNKHIMKEAEKSDDDFREEIGTNSRNHWIMIIEDIQPKSFHVLLEFLYTGIVQNVQDFDSLVILDVFWLALKYKIK